MNMFKIMQKFPFKKCHGKFILSLLICVSFFGAESTLAAGSCDTYAPTQGQTVTCSPTGTTSTGVQTPQENTTVNNVTVNINPGTELNINGSTVGIGSGSTVNNSGSLNTKSFFNGYGISFGVNGRSNAGGNTAVLRRW